MNGTNAAGRRVSLLNDNDNLSSATSSSSSQSVWYSRNSRYSSAATTPSLGPQTPVLERSSSRDSSVSSPSPVTPALPSYEHQIASPPMLNGAFYSSRPTPTHSRFPSTVSFTHQLPPKAPHAPEPQLAYYAPVPVPAARGRASSAPKVPTRKNSYACPYAAQYNCPDFFTTSGHAARHAKKHTGRKDAVCPECNKAFTRKDNMEQHRRTHQSGRASGKSEESRVKKPKSTTRRPKPAPLQPSITGDRGLLSSDILSATSTTFSGELNSLRISAAYTPLRSAHPDSRSCHANGLEALAFAASSRPGHY